MFCNQCGKENNNDAKFCSSCGNKLAVHSIDTINEPLLEPAISLWNPITATILGFFFTSIFTALILEKNWKELGLKKKANDVLIFNFGACLLGFYILVSTNINNFHNNFLLFYSYILGINIWFNISLYFTHAQLQAKVIKNFNYNKKSFIEYSSMSIASLLIAYFQFRYVLSDSLSKQEKLFEVSEPFAVLIGIFSICYLFFSCWEWLQRKSKNEIPQSKGFIDWGFTLCGYLLVSMFAYLPFFFLFKILEISIFTTYWYLGILSIFILLTFFRRA